MKDEILAVAGEDPAEAGCAHHDGGGDGGGDRPWLSLLVPVYNVRPFVAECLASILDQMAGRSGIELILLDDCSTDGSAELCEDIIARAPVPVRLLRHERNRGLSAARNSMLEEAAGDYVWFLDSDDAILPGAIDALSHIVAGHRPDAILCDFVREDGVRQPTFDGPAQRLGSCTETLVAGVFAKRRLHIWSRVWKRDLFGSSIRFPEGAWFEDAATVPWLMLAAKSHYYTAEPWVFYRSRPGSIIAQIKEKGCAFNRQRHDDLALALSGFPEDLARAVPHASGQSRACIARFQSRQFVKIAKRLLRTPRASMAWPDMREEIGRYRRMMEACSPMPFAAVGRDHLRRGEILRAVMLTLALLLAARSAASGVRDGGIVRAG